MDLEQPLLDLEWSLLIALLDPECLPDLGLLLLDSLLSERDWLLDLERDLEVEEFIVWILLAGNREENKIKTAFQNLIVRTI